MTLKDTITTKVQDFVKDYAEEHDIHIWRQPLVGFADAQHEGMAKLKILVSPQHVMPWEVLPEATVVVASFVPFTKELAETNSCAGLSSPQWALAYEQTNAMFNELNAYLIREITAMGYKAAITPEATTFDRKKLVSHWSHRHIAYLAGLGTFGINNMLITKSGGCGRYSTVVTNLPIAPGQPLTVEYCMYKRNGKCGACVRRCPSGALTAEGYDRQTCFAVLKKNAEVYTDFGSSYTNEDGTGCNSAGSEVCGKCVVHVPCALCAPGIK